MAGEAADQFGIDVEGLNLMALAMDEITHVLAPAIDHLAVVRVAPRVSVFCLTSPVSSLMISAVFSASFDSRFRSPPHHGGLSIFWSMFKRPPRDRSSTRACA